MSRAEISIADLPPHLQRKARALVEAEPSPLPVELGLASPLRVTSSRRSRATDREHPLQVDVIAWADDPATLPEFPELKTIFAVPNWFGANTKQQGARAKAEGRRSGMPDLCLPSPRRASERGPRVYGALYIEMKDESGTVRRSQRDRIAALRAAGNRCEVAMSVDAAKAIIIHYLGLPKP